MTLIEKYFCLNCNFELRFEDNTNYIITCENCNWRNELNDIPAINPIVIKTKSFEDFSCQICYPLIEERDLQDIPEALKEAVLTYFKNPPELEKKHRDNIYHNLYKKNAIVFEKIAQKYRNKAMLVRYFQNSNLFTIKKKKIRKN